MKAMPSGTSRRPSMPERKNSGTKLTMIISVELNIGMRTSRDASNTTLLTSGLSPSGSRRRSLRRLKTFSTSTIASSTSEPIAIAMPPRLMVFIVSPMAWSVSIVTTSDRGMVTRDIIVVLTFMRKRNSTMMTKNPPS